MRQKFGDVDEFMRSNLAQVVSRVYASLQKGGPVVDDLQWTIGRCNRNEDKELLSIERVVRCASNRCLIERKL